ncbi:MAG: hypothetical protein ABI978_05535 [Chloroflexota bacterium]
MDEAIVREHAQAHCDALLAGDIGKAAEEMSSQLRSNLGPLVAMLPMPLTEATVESVEHAATGFLVVLHLVGESTEIRLETRWKERDGVPTIVEFSHLKDAVPEPAADADEGPPPEG